VVQLNPQSATTLQWDQSFPTSGFYPVKVVVDQTNVLYEDNELNNFAIRPVLTGDYQLPGGINVDATVGPLTLQAGQGIAINGTAQYYGIDPAVNPDVAGATVIAKITNGGQVQTTTLPDGAYSLSTTAPTTPGTYSLNIEVTDYTLTGYQGPITFTVLPAPPRPDLSVFISLDRNTIITGEQISGSVVLQNVGDLPATDFLFRYFNCDAVLGEEQIASLAPGESKTYSFTTTTGVIGDCFNRSNCQFSAVADVGNKILEKTELNNQSSAYLTVLPAKPDLTPLNTSNAVIPGTVNMLNPFTFSVHVDNIGGVNTTTPFTVNVYMDDVLIRTENVPFLNTCDGNTFTITHDFGGATVDKVLTIKVDEPIGSGVIDEYRETNNEFSKIIRHAPPPPQYPNLQAGNQDFSVSPALPPALSPFDVNLVYRNNGQQPIAAPFKIEITVTEGGIPRIETQTINETILPGATRTVTLNTSLATDGDHSARVRLDSDNSITEGSEGDNIAQMPLCVDLLPSPIGNVWGSFYLNTLQHLTARIYNYGLFTPTDVSVSFYLDDVKIASTVVPVVQPTINVGYYGVSIPHIFDQAGTFQLKVVVDDPAGYTECREDNNEYTGTIRVMTPAPDVRVFSEYISPSKINPDVNEPITIFLSYDNAGIGDSGPFKARVMVDDVPLGVDVNIPSVAAGDDGTVEVPMPYNSPTAGIRVIRAILDPDAGLTETTTLNNHATRALVVGKAPNLFFTDLQADINCPDDGTNVVITASISNDGDLDATAEVVFYYIEEADTIPIDNKTLTLAGHQSTTLQTEWTVINKTFFLYAQVRNSDPMEYDESDNFILTKFCGGPYYNLFVQTEGQGITRKTPELNRYEGAQQVTVTATAATGWVFAGWQGDATGVDNPLMVNLSADQTIVAVFNEPLSAPGATNIERCGPGSVTFQATGAVSAQSYRWYAQASGGNPIPDETASTLTIPDLSVTTSYYVSIASFNNEGPRSEVKATILPGPPQPEVTVDGELNCPDENNPTVMQAPAGFAGYLWSGDETTQQIQVTAAGTFSVQVVDDKGCVSAPSANVVVTEVGCDEVIVYNAISANDDDLNPFLRILNVDRFPDTKENTLKIYNRWGDVVFKAENYDNTTNTFTGLTNDGKKLPSGTYFYILEFNNSGRKKISGYLALRR
jgi:gliding motility-associated-like protein